MLANNVASGSNVLLAETNRSYVSRKVSLFGGDQDSVILKRLSWGAYDIGVAQAFIQRDTLTKIFSMANRIDSLKWAALYLPDEDRPLSVSGKTKIIGPAFIPKAGVKEAYVEDNAYEGDKRLVIGIKHNSDKTLPTLDQKRLEVIENLFKSEALADDNMLKKDSINNSFNTAVKFVNLKKRVFTINNKLGGYVLIRSDTTITIDSSAKLNNVIVCAPSVIINEGFHGSCQVYATDSVHIGKNCKFDYPSVVGVTQFTSSKLKSPGRIVAEAGLIFNGILFSYQKEKSEVLPVISLGEHTKVTGEIYSQGILNYKKKIEIDGSILTNRFIYQSSYTRYENYLINVELNSMKLSSYYLSSDLLPSTSTKTHVLQWLK